MPHSLLTVFFLACVLGLNAQNDFSIDQEFFFSENIDFGDQYLENLSNGGVAVIDTSLITVIDETGAISLSFAVPIGWKYSVQEGVDQMSTFYDVNLEADFAVFYDATSLLKVNLSTGDYSVVGVIAPIGNLTFEVDQVTHAFDSYFLVSYLVYVDSVYSYKTVGLINLRNGGQTYASDIFENYIDGGLGDYDRIVHLDTPNDTTDAFLVIDNNQVTHKIDYAFPDVEVLSWSDDFVVTVDNMFTDNFNGLGFTDIQSAYDVGNGRCLVVGTLGVNQFIVLDSDGTVYDSFVYPPYLINTQATITDVDIYDTSQGTTDFDPTNTHVIAMTFQSPNFLSPAPYGISLFDAQGCPWQFFANNISGSCVFNSQGYAGEGLNLNGNPKGVQFDNTGRIYVSGAGFETFNQQGANTVFRLGGFENGSVLILGCTDVLARNWMPEATLDDGSCDYSDFNMICFASVVGADSSVVVNWAEGFTDFEQFRIYRESGELGVYDLIATVDDTNDDVRSFNDTEINAFVQEHRYKVIGLLTPSDTTSGNTPLFNMDLVGERGTIKLNSLPDVDNKIVLTWNAPANTPLVSYYIIEADTDMIIDTVSANVTSYTVLNPTESGDYYVAFNAPECEDQNAQGLVNEFFSANATMPESLVRSNADNVVRGCTYETATNYNPNATADDGSCEFGQGTCDFFGCLDPEALNYNPNVTADDGSCLYTACLSDLNGDGIVAVSDLLLMLGAFGSNCY